MGFSLEILRKIVGSHFFPKFFFLELSEMNAKQKISKFCLYFQLTFK